ncbi:hypothetical protein LZ30DRAFT_733247 [Colletotrichum cereale]|nr:hypothetical protein LZ30DRAFT_733247 [Colletotrichum cereale]
MRPSRPHRAGVAWLWLMLSPVRSLVAVESGKSALITATLSGILYRNWISRLAVGLELLLTRLYLL